MKKYKKLTWENIIKDANDKMIQMLELSDMTSKSYYKTAQRATVTLWKQMLQWKVRGQQGLPSRPSGSDSACQQRRSGSMGWEDPLKKEMATHSSILAWKISWTKETGGCSPCSHRVRHNLATKTTDLLITL